MNQRRLTWVATPPSTATAAQQPRPRRRYTGPPAYPVPPRWGFPQLSWRWPTAVPGTQPPVSGTDRVLVAARSANTVLVLAAIAAGLAAFGEFWRYVLLVRSRTEQLTPGTLITSDVWVNTTSVLAILLGLMSAMLVLLWLHRARQLAEERSGAASARPDWQVWLGLLPGLNLVLPFSVLAELEHATLRRPPDARPRPGRLVCLWWAGWLLGAALFVAALLWPLRGTSVQALADGVLLHGWLDLSGILTAVLTALVIRRITLLLGPDRQDRNRFHRVLRVSGADTPPRRQRAATAAR